MENVVEITSKQGRKKKAYNKKRIEMRLREEKEMWMITIP